MSQPFDRSETAALRRDQADPLRELRARFHIPQTAARRDVHYFCGNSLGLMPRRARELLDEECEDWRDLAVNAHFGGRRPWYSYHEQFTERGARLVGARSGEVVMMNSLTVNLHLLMVSFFRPAGARRKILIEDRAFPSDLYAAQSQLRFHGLDPAQDLIVARPRAGESTLRTIDLEALIHERRDELALVLLGGVNFYSGQLFELERVAAAAHAAGACIGYDLAHAAGNVELRLHDWDVDFAVWCNYKYLNSGPGAIGGCFVHERHAENRELPRFAGWWGNDPAERFRMHLIDEFVPHGAAEGWQLSNPSIFAMAPLIASLEIFDSVGMAALRAKSMELTGYLESLVDAIAGCEILTPRSAAERGAQLSIRIPSASEEVRAQLETAGCVCDSRPPDVIRVAPVPLYNRFHDCWTFARELERIVSQRS
ncbi:MAG: kynureninase [Planctomycetota bacterium]